EVEALAELLPQRETRCAIDTAAEGRVHDELHAAALVEEALQYQRLDARYRPQRPVPLGEIGRGLLRGGARERVIPPQPVGERPRFPVLSRYLRAGKPRVGLRAQA